LKLVLDLETEDLDMDEKEADSRAEIDFWKPVEPRVEIVDQSGLFV
jgi:hypothetical protein